MTADQNEASKHKQRIWPRVAIFFAALAATLAFANTFLQPIWPSAAFGSSNKDAFYNEPENTIQCVFVGASTFIDGISPLTMYEEQGICSYNLATEQQPTMMSYYWVKEAYRLHPNTLKAVVLDASMLRRTPDDAWYQKALAGMHPSAVKLEAMTDRTRNPVDFLSLLFPVADYHDRWSEPNDSDFYKYSLGSTEQTRGFIPNYRRVIDSKLPNLPTRKEVASASASMVITDKTATMDMNFEAISYLQKLAEFCNEKSMTMIIMKATGGWSQEAHNATQQLADAYGIAFLDYNVDPYFSSIHYNVQIDSMDGGHMDYFGAMKLSSHLGVYLAGTGVTQDIRGNASYAHMDEQLAAWHSKSYATANMWDEPDVCAYIRQASIPGHTVFVTVKDDAATSLSAVQRNDFAAMGLDGLATLRYRDSYLAIIENGQIQTQKVRSSASAVATKKPLVSTGALEDGVAYALTSGGLFHGNVASCMIDEAEYAPNQRGINVVVYDNTMHRVSARTWFDTFANPYRASFSAQYLL